jgi:uncharacterized protein (TIGR02246 family)
MGTTETQPQTQTNASQHAVRAVIDDVYTAWQNHDATAFVAGYADDATAILPGAYLGDRQAVLAAMQAAFDGPLKGSSCVYELQSMRFLGDAAIVIGTSAAVMAGETEPPASRWGMDTWVLARSNGGWLVKAFHTCPKNAA